ncbi:MAG TPA: hydrogenase maturation nickel metallochaperone HypA [Candidatus Dormibacteraeota bacterium]|nr:hydrogenase maturation nickel metallochaperone HypA [Candidatus Dormibacteraeota bacterium]
MHEMGIANSILESVRAEARRFPGGHICKVGVRVGELSGVNPEAMTFCFEALVRGTDLEPLGLDVEYCLRRHECRDCGQPFIVDREGMECPECGSLDSRFIGGDELELIYLEVDDGAHAAGA